MLIARGKFNWVHIKTGHLYRVLNAEVTNATNAQDGQRMVLYQDKSGRYFVREEGEFLTKFKPKDNHEK